MTTSIQTNAENDKLTLKLRKRKTPSTDDGYPDFFDNRHKRKMLKLAEIKPSDAFYDLGCGDASLLILAVKEFNVKEAIGIESHPLRYRKAKWNVKKQKLSNRISIIEEDMYQADLSEADVIFKIHSEGEFDLQQLFSKNIRNGTRLIKHDLPLLGYLPDRIDNPFYRMSFPLKKALTKNHWASEVLGKRNAHINDVWYELFYYNFAKDYSKYEIDTFRNILSNRIKR
jgi:trans-aconitate methyltransferase